MDRLLEATYRVEQRHFWWTGLRAFVGPLAAEATRGLTAARILDCGCGTGANLQMLETYGRAWGFDLSFRGLEYRARLRPAASRAGVDHEHPLRRRNASIS